MSAQTAAPRRRRPYFTTTVDVEVDVFEEIEEWSAEDLAEYGYARLPKGATTAELDATPPHRSVKHALDVLHRQVHPGPLASCHRDPCCWLPLDAL